MKRWPPEWQKIFVNYILNNGLISKICIEIIWMNIKKLTTWLKKGRYLNRHFAREDLLMANRYMKRYSTSLIICCCPSVSKLCLTLCIPMDCSMPNSPVLHYLSKFVQIRVHWVKDAISILPSIFPSIRVFSRELVLYIRWPKFWNCSFSISLPMNIQGQFPSRLTGLISLQPKGLSRVISSTTFWKHQFFSTQPSSWSNFYIRLWVLEKS